MNSRLVDEIERSKRQAPLKARWKTFLCSELQFQAQMRKWSEGRWREELRQRPLLSQNHDTFVSLDWPHYCSGATEACGGERGWCYTFSGSQASEKHREKVAYVDYVARKFPKVFAERVIEEIHNHVTKGRLPYPNLRFSGSGEMSLSHVGALSGIKAGGVHLWGFTRNLRVAERLHEIGIAVLFSCDSTTRPEVLRKARELKVGLAYTSRGVDDEPPRGTIVTFPLHRSGLVKEVVDAKSLCPKVVEEYLNGHRHRYACQMRCQRCHLRREKV